MKNIKRNVCFSGKDTYKVCVLFIILFVYPFLHLCIRIKFMFSCSTKFDYTSVRENPTLKYDVSCVDVKNEPLKVAKSFCKWRNIIDVDKNTGRVLSNALSKKKCD